MKRSFVNWTVLSLCFFFVSTLSAQTLPEMRMTPSEITATTNANDTYQVGSSELKGVHTKVLFGDPEKAGYYSILLFVPPHTTIQAHSHRDDRMATVVSGDWYLGYGDHFDGKLLKRLPPGSVYSEPAGQDHFARSGVTEVVVEISGYGPTNTKYFDPANDPMANKK